MGGLGNRGSVAVMLQIRVFCATLEYDIAARS